MKNISNMMICNNFKKFFEKTAEHNYTNIKKMLTRFEKEKVIKFVDWIFTALIQANKKQQKNIKSTLSQQKKLSPLTDKKKKMDVINSEIIIIQCITHQIISQKWSMIKLLLSQNILINTEIVFMHNIHIWTNEKDHLKAPVNYCKTI